MGEINHRVRLALLLAVPFVALMLLVPPRGDFPLNDDWVYAKMVQALAEDGHIGFSPLSNAFAITQTLYAAPLVKLFGFSFTLLRLTTIFMAWVTVCTVAFTARELGLPNRSALLAGLTVLVNPLFINLSYTFMTDVPFCAFASISTYYFVKALRTPLTRYLLLGTLFSIAAFYNRQLGVLIPFAFVAVALMNWSKSRSYFAIQYFGVLLVPWILAFGTIFLLNVPESEQIVPKLRGGRFSGLELVISFLLGAAATFFYIGTMVAPLGYAANARLLALPNREPRIYLTKVVFASLLLSVFALAWLIVRDFQLVVPILRLNEDVGVGVVAFSFLRPSDPLTWLPVQVTFRLPRLVLFVLCFLVCTPSVIVVTAIFGRLRSGISIRAMQRQFLLAQSGLLILLPAFAMTGPYFDRYFLGTIHVLALLAVTILGYRPQSIHLRAASFVSAMLFVFSVAGVQDYMAWNTARWQGIKILRTKYGAHDYQIDAGYEFNGMYTSQEFIRLSRTEPYKVEYQKWWVVNDTYRVSPIRLRPRLNDEILKEVPYFSWMGFTTRYVYLYGPKAAES
ncbi:MAG: glycosyltransferase family 39 protein [Candidatus Hydrogenedentes bacterium]|nr:glycosyltransferase family 39 protein [Candidatus Hydrogenedentota bacterium]